MSEAHIPRALRERVAQQARYRCGYCLTAEAIVGTPMEIDHLIPQSLGGPTEEDNLWLACSLCNDHKGDRIAALDSLSGEIVRLFDPRRQVWRDHFVWTADGDRVVGLTTIGLELLNAQILRGFIDAAAEGQVLPVLTQGALLFLAISFATQLASVAEIYVATDVGRISKPSAK